MGKGFVPDGTSLPVDRRGDLGLELVVGIEPSFIGALGGKLVDELGVEPQALGEDEVVV